MDILVLFCVMIVYIMESIESVDCGVYREYQNVYRVDSMDQGGYRVCNNMYRVERLLIVEGIVYIVEYVQSRESIEYVQSRESIDCGGYRVCNRICIEQRVYILQLRFVLFLNLQLVLLGFRWGFFFFVVY